MKKLRYVLAILVLLALSTACGQETDHSANSIASVSDVISAQMALKDNQNDANAAGEQDDAAHNESNQSTTDDNDGAAASTTEDGIVADVDLTALSSTMIYAEVYNMVTMPLVYHGKTVKVTGFYDEYYDVMSNELYGSIFVMDALACCAQGLSVQFSEDYLYPDDYPEDGEEITVYATFEIYYPEEDSMDFYYHLVDGIVLE